MRLGMHSHTCFCMHAYMHSRIILFCMHTFGCLRFCTWNANILYKRYAIIHDMRRHSCTVCHQHELLDGTRVLGFEPKNSTMGLVEASWSEWRRASKRYGDRHGKGIQFVLDKCERCWQARRRSQIASNERKKSCRAKRKQEMIFHSNADPILYPTHTENLIWSKFASLKVELETDSGIISNAYTHPHTHSYTN